LDADKQRIRIFLSEAQKPPKLHKARGVKGKKHIEKLERDWMENREVR